MLKFGDNSPAVGLLKTFLDLHPRIPTAKLQLNNLFDKETRSAVAYVQKHKGLPPTGRMNFETWLALGTESNPIQIKSLFASDRTLQDLLGFGYLLKQPYISRIAQNNNSVITTRSANPAAMPAGDWSFTYRLFVSVFAPFDWFGPFNLSAGDKSSRRFGTDPNASYRLQCFSTITAMAGDGTYDWTWQRRNPSVTQVFKPTTSLLMVPLPALAFRTVIVPGMPYPKTAFSPGHLKNEESLTDFDLPGTDQITNNPNRLKFHFFGNDRAFRFSAKQVCWHPILTCIRPSILFIRRTKAIRIKFLCESTETLSETNFPPLKLIFSIKKKEA